MIELSARELGLLEVLLQRAGRLVSKDQLVERLCEWGEEVSNNAIEVYIHRLRKKIEKGPVRIATVRGLGYCLEKIPPEPRCARATRRCRALKLFQREQRSLFGEILDWMLTPLLLLWPVSIGADLAGGAGHRQRALRPRARQDGAQLSRAGLVDAAPARAQAQFMLPQPAREILRADDADHVYYQVLGAARRAAQRRTRRCRCRPTTSRAAPGEVRLRDDEMHDEPVRVAYLWVAGAGAPAAPPALVQVAETLGKQSVLATEIIKGVMLPQFVILPLAVLLVWLALVRGIEPLPSWSSASAQRDSRAT